MSRAWAENNSERLLTRAADQLIITGDKQAAFDAVFFDEPTD